MAYLDWDKLETDRIEARVAQETEGGRLLSRERKRYGASVGDGAAGCRRTGGITPSFGAGGTLHCGSTLAQVDLHWHNTFDFNIFKGL
jgi:hypothetical protein